MHHRNRRRGWSWPLGLLLAAATVVPPVVAGEVPPPGATVAPPAEAGEVSSRPQATASFDADVLAVAYRGSVVYAGGRFSTAATSDGTVTREHLAAVDARTGALLDWAPRADGGVQAIAVYGDTVFLGGAFGYVNGEPRTRLAKLDATTGELDPDWAPSVTGRVMALAIGHGKLYVGGSFDAVDGEPRANVAAVGLDSGTLDPEFVPATEGDVRTIAVDGSRAYLGGRFGALNGDEAYRKLAAVDPVTGATDTGFRTGISDLVRDVVLGPDGPYAATGGQGGELLAFAPDGTERWAVTADGDFQAVTLLGGTVYAGGHFTEICATRRTGATGVCQDGATPRGRLAAVSPGGTLLGWAPEADSAIGVQAMAASAELGTVAVGGAFTTFGAGEIEQPHFAHFT